MKKDPEVKGKMDHHSHFMTGNVMWETFVGLNMVVSGLLRTVSQLGLVLALLRKHSTGPLFLIVCLQQPLVMLLKSDSLWALSKLEY